MCIIFDFEIDSLQHMFPIDQSRNEPTSEMGVIQRHFGNVKFDKPANMYLLKPKAVFVFGNEVFPT